MDRALRCYAEGRDGEWEAICLDLDIAVQGKSFEEVFQSLDEAVNLYLESTSGLPEVERARFLNRATPLSVRLKFLGYALRSLFDDRGKGDYRHQFTMPRAA